MTFVSVQVSGLAAAQAKLRGLADRKINVAAVAALNSAAYVGAQKTKEQIRSVFDRPTPWVVGGVRYIKASREKLESKIDLDFWGNKQAVSVEQILKAEIFGGPRRNKRHEIALQRAGLLPPGMSIVPGAAAQRDAYGNMKGSQIVQIISWFQAFGEQGYKANMTDKRKVKLWKGSKSSRGFQYFALLKPQGKLLPGIYIRKNYQRVDERARIAHLQYGAAKPVMIFVGSTSYRRRLDFYGIAERHARAEFNRFFPAYLDQLLKERGL